MKRMLPTLLPLALLISPTFTSCTDDQKKLDEIVQSETNSDRHHFTVDKDGKVNFKAEIVYFKFDDYTLTHEGMQRLDALAKYLKNNQSKKLRIEGHCDERGSTEYNLALGELRAQAVLQYLSTLNVDAKSLDLVSFGEEKPASSGVGESNWAQNRRAEFTFLN